MTEQDSILAELEDLWPMLGPDQRGRVLACARSELGRASRVEVKVEQEPEPLAMMDLALLGVLDGARLRGRQPGYLRARFDDRYERIKARMERLRDLGLVRREGTGGAWLITQRGTRTLEAVTAARSDSGKKR